MKGFFASRMAQGKGRQPLKKPGGAPDFWAVFLQEQLGRVMPRDLHLSTLDLELFPTVCVRGVAELVVEEGLKRIFSIYQPTPTFSHFSE